MFKHGIVDHAYIVSTEFVFPRKQQIQCNCNNRDLFDFNDIA